MEKRIKIIEGKHRVESEGGRNMGEYTSEEKAKERLGQIEHFKKQPHPLEQTEFVKQYPQHIEELKNEIRFRLIGQKKAEILLAKKYNLPILDKLSPPAAKRSSWENFRRMDDNWFDALKVSGPVTSTTAGIATKPLFGRKKKKKIILKAPVKKTRFFRYKTMLFNQEFGTLHDKVQQEYIDWKQTLEGKGLADIGITGRGHRKDGSQGKNTLLEHVEEHIETTIQRPGQSQRKGVNFVLTYLDKVILHENSIITQKDEDKILAFIGDIKKFWETKSNPRNIVFTQPRSLRRRGEKWVEVGKEEVFGHYRTPMYIDKRLKVDGIKEKISAVDSSWYDTAPNQSTPPFYQAIFSNSSLDESGGDTVTNGILGILERFEKSLEPGPGTPQTVVIIQDNGKMKDKLDTLKLLPSLKGKIKQIMKGSSVYRGNTGKVLYGGGNGIIGQLENTRFKSNKTTTKYLAKIAEINLEADETPIALESIDLFSIKFTKATIDNLINEWVRGEGQFKSPSNRPMILATDTTSKLKRYSWYQQYLDAQKVEKKVVKKSWTDMLWG